MSAVSPKAEIISWYWHLPRWAFAKSGALPLVDRGFDAATRLWVHATMDCAAIIRENARNIVGPAWLVTSMNGWGGAGKCRFEQY